MPQLDTRADLVIRVRPNHEVSDQEWIELKQGLVDLLGRYIQMKRHALTVTEIGDG